MITLEDISAHLVNVYEEFFIGGVSDTSSFGLKTGMVNSLNIIVRFGIASVSISIKLIMF